LLYGGGTSLLLGTQRIGGGDHGASTFVSGEEDIDKVLGLAPGALAGAYEFRIFTE
jgi:hypothetical protein